MKSILYILADEKKVEIARDLQSQEAIAQVCLLMLQRGGRLVE